MKHTKLLRITGIALILALLMITVVAAPVSAAAAVLTPTTGLVGTTVTVLASGFVPSDTYYIYFSNQAATLGQTIGAHVTVYQTVASDVADATGIVNTTFNVPSAMTSTGSIAVTAGTYYVYIAVPATGSIVTSNTFTVTSNPAITLNPASGMAGASVVINGTGFNPSTVLIFIFDSTTVTPTAGQTSTLSTGAFSSTITVPSTAAAGTHTITATAGSTTANTTFTVTASPTLDALSPATGPAGTDVVITGSAFPASTPLTFQFDSTTITRKYGDSSTRTSGIFISTVTIPTGVSTGTHTITVTAGSASASATFTVTATATLDALSPSSGPAGTDVTISGSNFPASTAIIFSFDGTAITPKSGDTATRTSGIFSSIITIPSTATVAAHTITVTAGTASANATFTVTETVPTATLSISADGNTVGSSVVLWGSGFEDSSTIVISYDGTKIAEGTTGADGNFVTSPFQIPPSTHGDHIISVTDGVNTAEVTFTVESTPPAVPVEAAPALGAALKTPYIFDWNDVTDPSAPVKYDLQISTDSSFTSSLILNKTGLMESQYKLTDSEASMLSSDVAVYYWRVRAVDAASNASAWSSTGQFHVTKPFSFIGWPLWLTISIGGVALFLLGYWLGRRTAFSY